MILMIERNKGTLTGCHMLFSVWCGALYRPDQPLVPHSSVGECHSLEEVVRWIKEYKRCPTFYKNSLVSDMADTFSYASSGNVKIATYNLNMNLMVSRGWGCLQREVITETQS